MPLLFRAIVNKNRLSNGSKKNLSTENLKPKIQQKNLAQLIFLNNQLKISQKLKI